MTFGRFNQRALAALAPVSYTHLDVYKRQEIDQEFFDKIYEPGTVSSEEEFRAKIKANIEENLISDSDYKFGVDAQKALLEKYTNLVSVSYTHLDAYKRQQLLRHLPATTERCFVS